jgi:hypothetical protein
MGKYTNIDGTTKVIDGTRRALERTVPVYIDDLLRALERTVPVYIDLMEDTLKQF